VPFGTKAPFRLVSLAATSDVTQIGGSDGASRVCRGRDLSCGRSAHIMAVGDRRESSMGFRKQAGLDVSVLWPGNGG